MESKLRSLVKGVLYRIIGTSLTFGVSFSITGSLPKASLITLILLFSKVGIYFAYERIWNKIGWGRRKERE